MLRAKLQDHVKDVRLSSRLTSSPACLVGEEGDLSPRMAELFRRTGQPVPVAKRILELNPTHPLLPKLQAIVARDRTDPALAEYAELLYGQAILAEGGQLPGPGRLQPAASRTCSSASSDRARPGHRHDYA